MDPNALLGFHLTTDSVSQRLAAAVLADPVAHRVGTHTEDRHILVRERSLTYQFSPHYHPWVTELTRRLLAGSTAGLQAVDTEYGLRVSDIVANPAEIAVHRARWADAQEQVMPGAGRRGRDTQPDAAKDSLRAGCALNRASR